MDMNAKYVFVEYYKGCMNKTLSLVESLLVLLEETTQLFQYFSEIIISGLSMISVELTKKALI